jgi:hypothetical protein
MRRTLAWGAAGLLLVMPGYALAGAPGVGSGSNSDQTVKSTWITGLKAMTAQLNASMLHGAGVIGAMIDGANAVSAQLTMQALEAEAYRDYTPGESLCRFGTLARSLAASDASRDDHAAILNTYLLDRETHNNAQGPINPDHDGLARLQNVRAHYCNPGDNDGAPVTCSCDFAAGTCRGGIPGRMNRDIDFARLMGGPLTLALDFRDNALTDDEQDALAFLQTISAYRPIPSISPGNTDITGNSAIVGAFQRNRTVTAHRGIARHVLAEQMAKRAQGAPGAAVYMGNLLRELGYSTGDVTRYLSADTNNPSYNAQMEILTKKIYQNPNFYTNLVDKPANVLRAQAAMQAITLMQRRDLYEGALRRELMLSQMLELAIKDQPTATVRKRVQNIGGGG